jgi:phage terminase small subunit
MPATCRHQFVNEMLEHSHPLTAVDSAHLLIFYCTLYSTAAHYVKETRYTARLYHAHVTGSLSAFIR